LVLFGLVQLGVTVELTLLMVSLMSIGAALIAWRLHRACD
jgi:hypothetical protein